MIKIDEVGGIKFQQTQRFVFGNRYIIRSKLFLAQKLILIFKSQNDGSDVKYQ